MALPSSGNITLSAIQTETGTGGLNAAGGVAGFTGGGTTMTEFYGWSATRSIRIRWSYSAYGSGWPSDIAGYAMYALINGTWYTISTVFSGYTGASSWYNVLYDYTAPGGTWVLAFRRNNNATTWSSDFAICDVSIDGWSINESTSWFTVDSMTTNTSDPATALANSISVRGDIYTHGRFNLRVGTQGTPSSGTGPTGGYNGSNYFVYEASSSAHDRYGWLFTPGIGI